MLVIPAIDILEGQCVRLRQGRYDEVSVFSQDPAAMAENWVKAGAQYLHIVDLEGARSGTPQCLGYLPAISRLGIPLQIGGGFRLAENIRAALAAGASRVILGSRIASDPAFAQAMFSEFGEQVIAGIDAREGLVAIHGWQEINSSRITALDLARQLAALGARRVIYTDIARDGMLAGPNISSLQEMINALPIPVIASGGVTTLEDIAALAKTGAEGCIIGRALYTGDLDLSAAIELAANQQLH
jgi:phosphoribosylformimino-5-aminoimidazole carboxamide ribotide isomerase